jgi:phenylacetate-CoA ligase
MPRRARPAKPTVVGYTKLDIRTWADVCARSLVASGGRPGMKIHNAYGYGLFTGGLGVHYGAEKLGCITIPVSGGMTERQVKLIVDFKPDIITVTPSYMLAILDEFRAQKVDPARVLAQDRHLRCRAVDQRDAHEIEETSTCMRSISTVCPR